jgi:hypothetical protein
MRIEDVALVEDIIIRSGRDGFRGKRGLGNPKSQTER